MSRYTSSRAPLVGVSRPKGERLQILLARQQERLKMSKIISERRRAKEILKEKEEEEKEQAIEQQKKEKIDQRRRTHRQRKHIENWSSHFGRSHEMDEATSSAGDERRGGRGGGGSGHGGERENESSYTTVSSVALSPSTVFVSRRGASRRKEREHAAPLFLSPDIVNVATIEVVRHQKQKKIQRERNER